MLQGQIKFICAGCKTSKIVKGNVFPNSEGLYSLQVQPPYDHEVGRRWTVFNHDLICSKCTQRLTEALQSASS